ncbi:MAG: response regulator transcription factor [Leptolyngbya sp. UWPOB_LEPTO1]|uniref:response regulator transcription factor n=1 Tax=Leptolyngbya sp. UWPOB_LEPTO1 TaxID=2815653 RepID=UPI001ACFCAF0|nr:response regulator [Leptolyngbya sp. UWPOB_LEPTO1]MBN8564462.1 response regulator transcription factor [Leptolyngbya sp. UWPOB_LEPTO1]
MKTRLLLIEDQINLAHFIALELRAEGYQVIVEHHAKIGLIAAQVLCPDIIIMSWDLPGETASRAYHQLRSIGNKVPIVVMTVDTKPRHVLSPELNEMVWLMKPFCMSDLFKAIDQVRHTPLFVNSPQPERMLRIG